MGAGRISDARSESPWFTARRLLPPHVLHVHVGAESHVVGEVPAFVVGVVIDHNLIATPIPVVAIGKVKRRDPEVEAAEPKAIGAASGDAPDMASSEAAGESAMLKGLIEVEVGIPSSGVVPDPLAVMVNVRSLGTPADHV
jgi:hypothetical protein